MELEQTLKVAKSFRGVLVYFGMQYLIGFGVNAMAIAAQGAPEAAPLVGLVVLGGAVGAIFCLIMLLVSIYRCSSAMGSIGLLWVIAMFLPCLNLITLLAINSQAKTFLEKRGVKVRVGRELRVERHVDLRGAKRASSERVRGRSRPRGDFTCGGARYRSRGTCRETGARRGGAKPRRDFKLGAAPEQLAPSPAHQVSRKVSRAR